MHKLLTLCVFILVLSAAPSSAQDFAIAGFVRIMDEASPTITTTDSNSDLVSSNAFSVAFCQILGNEDPTPPGNARMDYSKDSGTNPDANVSMIFENDNGSSMICEYMFEFEIDGSGVASQAVRTSVQIQISDGGTGSVTLQTTALMPIAQFETETDGSSVALSQLDLGPSLFLSGIQTKFISSSGVIEMPAGQTTMLRLKGHFVISANGRAVVTPQINVGNFVAIEQSSWGEQKSRF